MSPCQLLTETQKQALHSSKGGGFLVAGESTRNTSVLSTIFVPNMTISPSLAKQFDSPKNQIPNINNNGTKTYHNHSLTDMLSIYLPITTNKSRQINGKVTDSNQPLNTIIPLDKTYTSPLTKANKPPDEPIFMKLATKKKYKPVALKVKPVIGKLHKYR